MSKTPKEPKTPEPPKKEKEPPKGIEIKTTKDVDLLIARAKAEKPKKKEVKKPKKRLGRPPKKKKPELDLKNYAKHPIAVTLNGFLVFFSNAMLKIVKKAPLTKDEKMTEEDCEVGEAICYSIEYYGLELAHPIVVILVATCAFGWQLFSRTSKIKETESILDAEKKHGT